MSPADIAAAHKWDIFVYWAYGAAVLLLGGYAFYLIRLMRQLPKDTP